MYFFYYLPIGINVPMRRFPFLTVAYSVICAAIFVVLRYFPDLRIVEDLYNLIYVPSEAPSQAPWRCYEA